MNPSLVPSLALLDGATVVPLTPGQILRRRGTDGIWRRLSATGEGLWVSHGDGAHARRERHVAGDVVHLGRRAALIVTPSDSLRCPGAITWRGFLARSPRMWRSLARLAAAAASAAPVWVRGESGTGKELAARALHDVGPRSSGPFVALNCAALPEALAEAELFGTRRGAFTGADRDRPGAFTRADGGTLFLDEVGELPLTTQAKLLRALELGEVHALGDSVPHRVNVRVVSATWRDLDADVEVGRFRFDLLQRLGVLRITMAPLRQRPEDIGPLLEAALVGFDAEDLWPSETLLEAIEAAPWPGNVRQLRSAAQRAAVWGDPGELRPWRRRPAHHRSPHATLPAATRRSDRGDRTISAHVALRGAGGNRTMAARSLGISRSTLYRWLASSPTPR